MGRMRRILEASRNEIVAEYSRNFAVLAEGPLEQPRPLQNQAAVCVHRVEAASI
jgi:hypothetical protein